MNVNSMNKWVGYPDFKLYMYMYLYNTLEKSGYRTHYHKQVIWGIVITKENTNGREIESRHHTVCAGNSENACLLDMYQTASDRSKKDNVGISWAGRNKASGFWTRKKANCTF